MECKTGDKVLIRVKLTEIQPNKSTDYSELFKFEVVGVGSNCWVIHVPGGKVISGSFELSSWDCGRYNINFKFSNERAYIIQESHIVKVYSKPEEAYDGAKCDRCSDYFPMAVYNEDGGFKCYLCTKYPFR